MAKKNYINSAELEEYWYGWVLTADKNNWEMMSNMIYQICSGVSTKMHPSSDEECQEHIHDAWSQVMGKIKSNKLRYIHGKAPVFNLITTTAFRILYSKMNRQKKQKEHLKKYVYTMTYQKAPDLIPFLEHGQLPAHMFEQTY